MTAAAGAGDGGRHSRIEGAGPALKGQCRGNLQLSAEKHKSDDNTGEQEKHYWTQSFHLNYPLRQILTGHCSELIGPNR
jgi:hypothetical protein